MNAKHHVVILGGGFGGLHAAKAFHHPDYRVTLLDKRNFHLFQPLLYQVATGGLSPGDIASPLRSVLRRQKNTEVLLGKVTDIDVIAKRVHLRDDTVSYDTLIVATGATHSYFGNPQWETIAPGLKTIEDATELRRKIFFAFEAAERERDPQRQKAWMRFVIIGGGPTGVELAGALGELAHFTLAKDFRRIDPTQAEILLVEGGERILPSYDPRLSQEAVESLNRKGVTVRTHCLVTDLNERFVTFKHACGTETIEAQTILWAAGIQASPLGRILADRTGTDLDRLGRVKVNPDLTLPGYPEILVLGDLAHFADGDGHPLPGVAPVAMQQGDYAITSVSHRLKGTNPPPFVYKDRGSMAVIGRAAAVAQLSGYRITGFFAWLAWLFIHVMHLVEYDNRVLVLIQWAWNYTTKNRGARLITGKEPLPLLNQSDQSEFVTTENSHQSEHVYK